MLRFASQGNFLDPPLTSDGKPFAPIRWKQIVKERFLISKNINTSYLDIGKMTPKEREYLLEFIHEDAVKTKEYLDNIKAKSKSKD